MIRSIAALVEVPLALLNRSTISCASGESFMVVLRELTVRRRAFVALPGREALSMATEDEVLALLRL